jgi:hypothetical protein
MPVSERAPRRVPLGLAALALLASTVACTADDDEPTDAEPTDSPSVTETVIPLKVRVDRVRGDLTPVSRKRVVREIAESLQRYLDGALLGDYPRREFALARFTQGAEQQARRDLDLLTGRAFKNAESVTARQLKAGVSVLAPEGRPAGATAKVRFSLDVDGVPVVLAGRLLLTPQQGTWRIFGYDVSSNATDAAAAGGDS